VVCGVCVYTDAVPLSVAFLRTFMAYSWLLSGGVTFRTKNTCAHIKKTCFHYTIQLHCLNAIWMSF